MAPEEVRENLRKIAGYYFKATIDKKKVGAVIGALNGNLGGNVGRRKVLAWIFCDDGRAELHRADMTNGQWLALYDWCAFREEDGHWFTGMDFIISELIKTESTFFIEYRILL